MILEDATKEAFGYYARDLTHGSAKPIIAACELCGVFRITSKNVYRVFCASCIRKGKNNHNFGNVMSEEQKAKISAVLKGKPRKTLTEEHRANIGKAQTGKKASDVAKANMSKAQKGKFGKKSSAWKGGMKLSWVRTAAKRRGLGHKLLMPLAKGEVGHHVMDKYIIGIPAEVHQRIGGSRRRHRIKVLQWLKDNDKKKYRIAYYVTHTDNDLNRIESLI